MQYTKRNSGKETLKEAISKLKPEDFSILEQFAITNRFPATPTDLFKGTSYKYDTNKFNRAEYRSNQIDVYDIVPDKANPEDEKVKPDVKKINNLILTQPGKFHTITNKSRTKTIYIASIRKGISDNFFLIFVKEIKGKKDTPKKDETKPTTAETQTVIE